MNFAQLILQRLCVDLPSLQEAKDAFFLQFNLYLFSFFQVDLSQRLEDFVLISCLDYSAHDLTNLFLFSTDK